LIHCIGPPTWPPGFTGAFGVSSGTGAATSVTF
jgi:hypothetical protein